MEKQRKPLSTKKPPIPAGGHEIIEEWMANKIMPGIQPTVQKIDDTISDLIPNLQYAVKWGNAYYGTKELGWLIEVAAYAVSVNVVFLNSAAFDPQPPLGSGADTRYVKIRTMDELDDPMFIAFIQQAGRFSGWK